MKILDIIVDKNYTMHVFKIYSDYDRNLFKYVVEALCSNYCFNTDIKEEVLNNLPLKKKIRVLIETNPNKVSISH